MGFLRATPIFAAVLAALVSAFPAVGFDTSVADCLAIYGKLIRADWACAAAASEFRGTEAPRIGPLEDPHDPRFPPDPRAMGQTYTKMNAAQPALARARI